MGSSLRIGFHSIHCGERGTTNAVFDYAVHAKKLLGHHPVLIWDRTCSVNNPVMREMLLNSGLDCYEAGPYGDRNNIDIACKELKLDLLYILKGGNDDGIVSTVCPTAVHAVFRASPSSKHGTVWAYISEYLSAVCSGGSIPFVPHMVTMPPPTKSLRTELGIPGDAVVFGRHGGFTQFDNTHAQQAVDAVLDISDNVWFLLWNTQPFGKTHPRKIYLPVNADRQYKANFVETCDAMLHGRSEGETFGLACGEFSIRNKPVFMPESQSDWAHLSVLTDHKRQILHCYRYGSKAQLVGQLLTFNPAEAKNRDWASYRRYHPEVVMRIFNDVFIKGAFGS